MKRRSATGGDHNSLGLVVNGLFTSALRNDLPEAPIRWEHQLWKVLDLLHFLLRHAPNDEVL